MTRRNHDDEAEPEHVIDLTTDPDRPLTARDAAALIHRLESLTTAVNRGVTARRVTYAILALVVALVVFVWRDSKADQARTCDARSALRAVIAGSDDAAGRLPFEQVEGFAVVWDPDEQAWWGRLADTLAPPTEPGENSPQVEALLELAPTCD